MRLGSWARWWSKVQRVDAVVEVGLPALGPGFPMMCLTPAGGTVQPSARQCWSRSAMALRWAGENRSRDTTGWVIVVRAIPSPMTLERSVVFSRARCSSFSSRLASSASAISGATTSSRCRPRRVEGFDHHPRLSDRDLSVGRPGRHPRPGPVQGSGQPGVRATGTEIGAGHRRQPGSGVAGERQVRRIAGGGHDPQPQLRQTRLFALRVDLVSRLLAALVTPQPAAARLNQRRPPSTSGVSRSP